MTAFPSTHSRFYSCKQQADIQADEIDIRDCEHHLTLQDYSLVENVAEEIREVEPVITEYVVLVHAVLSPTK